MIFVSKDFINHELWKLNVWDFICSRQWYFSTILDRNDIFLEMALIDKMPRSLMISALEDCSISVMTQEAFNSLAQHNAQALMPS